MGFPNLGAWSRALHLNLAAKPHYRVSVCDSSAIQSSLKASLPPPLSPQCTARAHHVVFQLTPTVDSRSSLAVLFSQVYVVRRDAAHLLVGRDVLPRNQDTICLWRCVHLGPSWWCYKTQGWLLKLNDLSWLKNLWKGFTAIYLFLSSIPWLMPLVQLCPDKVQIHWCHSTRYLLCVLNKNKKKKKWIITQRKYLQLWLNIFITCSDLRWTVSFITHLS